MVSVDRRIESTRAHLCIFACYSGIFRKNLIGQHIPNINIDSN